MVSDDHHTFWKEPNSMLKKLTWLMNRFHHGLYTRGAQRAHFSYQNLIEDGFHSQCGQDKWLTEVLLPNVREGVFIEIGAYDGIRFSNTFYLESRLDWTGLLIEPNPDAFEKLQTNRESISLQCCVSEVSGKQNFQLITGAPDMLSGLSSHRDDRHIDRIHKELAESGASIKEIEVKCKTLNELCQDNNIEKIDYLSIDVEGAEIPCLRKFDFGRFPVSVIGIENNYSDPKIPSFLKSKGFSLHSIVGDEFYVNEALQETPTTN